MASHGTIQFLFICVIFIGVAQSETLLQCTKNRFVVNVKCDDPKEMPVVSAVKVSRILAGYLPTDYCKNPTVLPSAQQCIVDEKIIMERVARKCGGRYRGKCHFFGFVGRLQARWKMCLDLNEEQAVIQTDYECKEIAGIIIHTPGHPHYAFTEEYYGCKLTFTPEEGESSERGKYQIRPINLRSYSGSTYDSTCYYKLRLTYHDEDQWISNEICGNRRSWPKHWNNLPENCVHQPLYVELYREAYLDGLEAKGVFNINIFGMLDENQALAGKIDKECSKIRLQVPGMSSTIAPSAAPQPTIPPMFLP